MDLDMNSPFYLSINSCKSMIRQVLLSPVRLEQADIPTPVLPVETSGTLQKKGIETGDFAIHVAMG